MTESTWAVAPALRSRVDVAVHNLLDPLPPEVGLCQIVFCRNVLIYFTAEHAAAFVDRLADALPPDAHLFLGGAESMLSRERPIRAPAPRRHLRLPSAAAGGAVPRASSASPPRSRPSRPRQARARPSATAKPVKRSDQERPTRRGAAGGRPVVTTASSLGSAARRMREATTPRRFACSASGHTSIP